MTRTTFTSHFAIHCHPISHSISKQLDSVIMKIKYVVKQHDNYKAIYADKYRHDEIQFTSEVEHDREKNAEIVPQDSKNYAAVFQTFLAIMLTLSEVSLWVYITN